MIKKRIQIRGQKYTFFRLSGPTEHQQFVDECHPFNLIDKNGNVDINRDEFADVNDYTVSYVIIDKGKVIAARGADYLDDEIESLYTTVHQSYRNLGIATRLFEETFKSAEKLGKGIFFKFYSRKAHKIVQKIQKKYPSVEIIAKIYYR